MPIYEYRCQVCGYQQEHLLKHHQTIERCPACGSDRYIKQLSRLGVISLKNTGGTSGRHASASTDLSPSCSEGSCPTCPAVHSSV
ncbi:MAG: zinc ribbon domain-containing protein [Hydrogenophilus sp.]|nr:zinc ribbon domain-containing protein [Hydrogenophilus sp.]